MSIEFHCTHCTKLIRAPREHGGKRGKCPYCKQSVYVPTAPDELDEIPLAPMDQDDEQRRKELEAESQRVQRALLGERGEPPPESGRRSQSGAETAMPPPRPGDGQEIAPLVLNYVTAMRDSNLDEADRICLSLRAQADAARNHVQRLLVDELPPPGLEGFPPALFKGFLRTLLDRL
ncbi:MAG: hypothetical protein ACYSUQ_02630 [Planctomycetota bacterium]|jgi:phage FluMu protein Com